MKFGTGSRTSLDDPSKAHLPGPANYKAITEQFLKSAPKYG
jgi:hypothetical protein